MKKHSLIRVALTGVFMFSLAQLACNSTAFGLTIMGPPRSLLQEGESAIGLEFGYSEMDLQTFGDITEVQQPLIGPSIVIPDYTEYKIKKLQSTMISARIDTNIFEDWDFFVRLGATDGTDNIKEVLADDTVGHEYADFDGDFGFSWGLGTRTTFYEQDNVTWGAIFQVNWAHPGKSDVTDESDPSFSGEAEIKYWEFQLAIGPTIEYENMLRIYGGPFLDFVKGDFDLCGSTVSPPLMSDTFSASHEIREESQIGGFLGAQWNLGNNNTLVTEAQLTDDAWGIGVSTTWKF
ncbi:MAG: hypothetical protein P8016_10945 [Sedimentisphaerales bacterium]